MLQMLLEQEDGSETLVFGLSDSDIESLKNGETTVLNNPVANPEGQTIFLYYENPKEFYKKIGVNPALQKNMVQESDSIN